MQVGGYEGMDSVTVHAESVKVRLQGPHTSFLIFLSVLALGGLANGCFFSMFTWHLINLSDFKIKF